MHAYAQYLHFTLTHTHTQDLNKMIRLLLEGDTDKRPDINELLRFPNTTNRLNYEPCRMQT